MLKIHSVGYNAVADNTGLSSFVLQLLPLKSAKSREILRKFELIALQGRVVNETYNAETETRPRHWSDGIETRPRRDVQNNVSRRSVESFKP